MAISDRKLSDEAASRSGGALSLIYDPKIRGLFFQFLLLFSIGWLIYEIIDNTIENLAARNVRSGFGFLGEAAGFQILTTPGTYVMDYQPRESTNLDIFYVGVINTFVVSFLGVIAATFIGFVFGVFRLSSNVILRTYATIYVEIFRNVPLLLQMLIWYKVLVALLPGKRDEPLSLFGVASIDKSGVWAPYPMALDGFWMTLSAIGLAIAAWIVIARIAKKRQAATGKPFPTFFVGLGLLILAPIITFLATGSPLEWEEPARGRFGFQLGVGMVIVPEMFCVWLALTLYTGAFIAEIVRGGILAINKGQTEASHALGLRQSQTLNLVIIPQALRVIIPPLTSQYLNLTKNSSLAVAIAYPDIVAVFAGTTLNQVGQAIEIVFMMMMVFLTFSLSISLLMNWYNKRVALVER